MDIFNHTYERNSIHLKICNMEWYVGIEVGVGIRVEFQGSEDDFFIISHN